MDVVTSIWLASLIGAALFFASGRLWARASYAAQPAGAAPDADRVAHALTMGSVETARRQRAEAELGRAAALCERLTQRDAATTRELERAQAELAAARRTITQLRAELSAATTRADKAVQLALENAALRAKNDELQRQTALLAESSHELAELRRRVAEFDAMGFGPAPRVEATTPRPPRAELAQRLESALEMNLEALRRREIGCRSAVLSDTRGLLIAAAGDRAHDDELAAVAALTSDTAERLRKLLPLGEPVSLVLRDAKQLLVQTRWLRVDDECFLLSSLHVRGAAPDASIEGLKVELQGLLGAS